MWTPWLIVALYFTALAGLAAWGFHRLVLLHWLKSKPEHLKTSVQFSPEVLVQLPIFNESLVVERLIDSIAGLDWPHLVIQVLDDSTDETSEKAGERIQYWRRKGVDISHIRRSDRSGFKAGALAHGLELNDSPFVAIFDADFVPRPQFLRQMMPSLFDSRVGMVQARWGHINRDQSLLTRLESLILDGHFVVEHTARFRRSCFFNFNGTAGIWRRDCIEDAGGWAHDTITEDLDLSYRAQLKGWKFAYRDDVIAPAEVPGTVRAFLTQQHRWAKGTVQTARKLTGSILQSDFPLTVRLEAINHLLMVAAYPAIFLLAVLLPMSIGAREAVFDVNLQFIDIATILATTGSLVLFYGSAMHKGGESLMKRWWEIPCAMALGVGSSASQTMAVLEGLFSSDATFIRTPKQGGLRIPQVVPQIPSAQLLITLGMTIYYLESMGRAALNHNWLSLPLLALFGSGFLCVSLSQLLEGSRTVEAVEMDVAPAAK